MFSFLREPIALLEDRMWLLSESQESRMMARFWSSWNARVAFIGDGDDRGRTAGSPQVPQGAMQWQLDIEVWSAEERSLFWRVNWGLSVRITFETTRLDEMTMAERAGAKQQRGKAKARVLCRVQRGQRDSSALSPETRPVPLASHFLLVSLRPNITIY